jgi:hypothetical protein
MTKNMSSRRRKTVINLRALRDAKRRKLAGTYPKSGQSSRADARNAEFVAANFGSLNGDAPDLLDVLPPSETAGIFIEIGDKDDLTDRKAERSVAAVISAAALYPTSQLMTCIGGFDDDPRPLAAIPEAADFLRRFHAFLCAASPAVYRRLLETPAYPAGR